VVFSDVSSLPPRRHVDGATFSESVWFLASVRRSIKRAQEKSGESKGYNASSSFSHTRCRRAATGEQGIRISQVSVLTGLGRPNGERSGGYSPDRLIPLEELAARTVIIHMRAMSQIEWMPKLASACWAVYPLSSVKNAGDLEEDNAPFIAHALSAFYHR